MTELEKARAMKCLGKLAEITALDPDPNTREDLTKEFNCFNCASYDYCRKLAKALKPNNIL